MEQRGLQIAVYRCLDEQARRLQRQQQQQQRWRTSAAEETQYPEVRTEGEGTQGRSVMKKRCWRVRRIKK